MNEWLNTKEAAEFWGVSISGVVKLIRKHRSLIESHVTGGGTGRNILISKEGLTQLRNIANVKRKDKLSSKESDAVKQTKQQIAEIAIEATTLSSDPVLAQLQQLMSVRKTQLNQQVQLDDLSKTVKQLTDEKEEALKNLLALPSPSVEAEKMTGRALIRQAVNTYAQAKNLPYNALWNKFYTAIYYRLGVNCQVQAKHRGISAMDILEEKGLTTEAYAIACEIFKM